MLTVFDSSDAFKNPLPELAILPLACFESHGCELSNNTDQLLMAEISRRVAERLPDRAFLLPPWPYGTPAENNEQASVISLRYETLFLVVRDLAQSLIEHGIKKIVVMNNHGSILVSSALPYGNSIVKTAVRQLNYEIPEMTAIWLQPFRVASEPLKAIFDDGIDITRIEKSILDHIMCAKNESTRKMDEINLDQCVQPSTELGKLALEEITRLSVEYILNTLNAIAAIKSKDGFTRIAPTAE